MSIRADYEKRMEEQQKVLSEFYGAVWHDQETRYVHPFRIYGNVWYVGDNWVCVHLIDTGDGLLLIDSGNCGATAMLVQAIWEAGFNPADVKWIIHSHGHVDHIGGANFFKNMYGTKLYLSAPDAKMFRERPELSAIQDSKGIMDTLFVPDVEIQDGDVLTFGNTEIRFVMVPGHTAGCIACFFDVYDGDEKKRAGYYGGFGFNTLRGESLREMGDPEFKTRQIYRDSLARVRDEKVEIFLGNHCINNDTMGRRKKQLENPEGPNPFVDSEVWGRYLDEKRDALAVFEQDPANN
ncbi:MAG: MBL fold metallo-hydrolase [Lachnospiraceae bacterium]|nr:MBL fold metallo-hydrolase [Lachnospiraceae bacterium]